MFQLPMNRTQLPARVRSRLLPLSAAVLAAVAALSLVLTASASASTSQISIIQDGLALKDNTPATMAQFRELGATTIRYLVFWKDIAPDPNAKTAPKGFKAANPGAYPAANWAVLDNIVTTAKAEGLTVDLDLTGPPPNWAQGSGVPNKAIKSRFGWKVNAADYGSFVQAVAQRFDGKFKPAGASSALPKVSLWSLWNEPNFGQDLGPQAVDATSKFDGYDVAAGYYRNLVRSGWSALQKYQKGSTILIGELAGQGRSGVKNKAHPQGLPGDYAITWPIPYIQTLYCVNAKYQRLTGTAAKQAGCPTTAAAARSFKKDNPGLFDASGFSTHPYASTFTPTATKGIGSQAIILPVIGRLTTETQKVTAHYGAKKTFPIYSTEYGFVTSPPQKGGQGFFSPATAATYLNEAEYLSYKNPRIRSFAQYLLKDPPVLKGVGLFSSGLLTDKGTAKPTYNAYRLPLWLPHQSVKKNASTEVWGGARPASFGYAAVKLPQTVNIQLQAGGKGAWTTIATATASKTNGYFDTHVKLATSGNLRLQYTYPAIEPFLPLRVAGSTVVSRSVKVTVH